MAKQARTVDVDVRFRDADDIKKMLAGYSADVEIILDFREDTLRIPTEAILDGKRVFLYQASEGIIKERVIDYLAKNVAIARSNGFEHLAFESLPQKYQKIIKFHESFKSCFWGMVWLLPVFLLIGRIVKWLLHRLYERNLKRRYSATPETKNLLDMRNEEILNLIKPEYTELKKHSIGFLCYF